MSDYEYRLIAQIYQALNKKDYVKLASLARRVALLKRDIPGKR